MKLTGTEYVSKSELRNVKAYDFCSVKSPPPQSSTKHFINVLRKILYCLGNK